jgi:hypothetical protein
VPTIVTRGVASARGAGTFSAAPPPLPPPPPSPTPPPPPPPPGPVLQTVTFFNNGGSWTAPAGITNLTSVYVVGGTDGMTAAQYVRSGRAVLTMSDNFAQPGNPLTAFTFAEANTYVNNLIANLNSGGTGDRSIDFVIINNNYNPSTGGFFNTFEIQNTIPIRGAVVLQSGPAFNQTNEIVYPFQSWVIAYDRYFPPEFVAGGPSSAFGYTAQGGAPPQEISQANVPVVPGQTYDIQVSPSSGLVQFQFIQG